MKGSRFYFAVLIHGGFIMYERYLQQLEEAGKIRNLTQTTINCYKKHQSISTDYLLMGKNHDMVDRCNKLLDVITQLTEIEKICKSVQHLT